jgi:hypothetical protein
LLLNKKRQRRTVGRASQPSIFAGSGGSQFSAGYATTLGISALHLAIANYNGLVLSTPILMKIMASDFSFIYPARAEAT